MSGIDPVLLRGLSAIEPYLAEVVVAGGWVPHVYELLYDATRVGRSPRTRDIDLAVPRSIAVKGKSIDELLVDAKFKCEFRSQTTPPVTKYLATEGEDIDMKGLRAMNETDKFFKGAKLWIRFQLGLTLVAVLLFAWFYFSGGLERW